MIESVNEGLAFYNKDDSIVTLSLNFNVFSSVCCNSIVNDKVLPYLQTMYGETMKKLEANIRKRNVIILNSKKLCACRYEDTTYRLAHEACSVHIIKALLLKYLCQRTKNNQLILLLLLLILQFF
jgi:hypothetical protein